jgi:hypothetical protein
MPDGLEERKELRSREEKREDPGDERGAETLQGRGGASEELPEKVDAAGRRAVEEGLRMTSGEGEQEGDDTQSDASGRAPSDSAQPEKQQRKTRDGRPDAPAVPEENVC